MNRNVSRRSILEKSFMRVYLGKTKGLEIPEINNPEDYTCPVWRELSRTGVAIIRGAGISPVLDVQCTRPAEFISASLFI